MLELNTRVAVESFIRKFRVVKRQQLKRFFRDRKDFDSALNHLLVCRIVFDHGNDIISSAFPGNLPDISSYIPTIRCVDALCALLQSGNVDWCDSIDYPMELIFLTKDSELYDMTYLSSSTWVQKASLLEIAWKRSIPPGEEDPINHLAVVESMEIAKKLRSYAFSQFIFLDNNGGILDIYDN